MTELPKSELPTIVRERLQALASGPVGLHPDADLLTAFCERTLTETERQQVIAHLALCADCRDAVALATPPQPSEAEPLRPHG
ncbi:MAG: zf-HC2 domain-containing protein, partial [Terriglobales bacterium]